MWQGFLSVSDGGYEHAQPPEAVADVMVHVADAEAPDLRYQTSRAIERLVGVKLADMTGEKLTTMTRGWVTRASQP
jgi:hypothetical protein